MSPTTNPPPLPRTILLASFALVAFALNSLFCRLALREPAIDPASFTLLRVAAGAVALLLLAAARGRAREVTASGSWLSGALLAAYALAFSLAYVTLSTGVGALLLFGAVQVTMIGAGLRQGEHLGPLRWSGGAVALAGLAWLSAPGLEGSTLVGALGMTAAGVAWGWYSLRGRSAADAFAATGGNFLRAVPFAVAAGFLLTKSFHVSPVGAGLAVLSGAITSGLGYVAWYAALKELAASTAATVQLLVPVLAALGGVLALGEPVTARLLAAGLAILGGVWLSLPRGASTGR